MENADVFAIFKPFAWMAALAFVVGFLGYVAIHPRTPDSLAMTQQIEPASATAVAADPWNFEKEI